MSAFSERLRFAITNYASGSVPYKSFAALVDIPYRTLQNYLSGERSPNIEALEKLSNNGIDINWLITGRGTPYNRDNIEKKLLDKIFLIYALDIIKSIFNPKNDMFDRGEKYAILSFIMRNNYLKIGDNLHDLLDCPDYYKSLEDMEFELASGKLEEEVFDLPPRNKIEMWKALQILKEKRGRDIIPPRAIESGWPKTKDVGE